MPSRATPSVREIAEEAGVSFSLVAKVLNNRLGTSGVSQATREKILKTAERMGYRKNFNAASLWTQRQNAIAMFIRWHGTAGNTLTERFLHGATKVLADARLRINLEFYYGREGFLESLPHLHAGYADGMILCGNGFEEIRDELVKIHKKEIPVLTVCPEPVHASIPNIGVSATDVVAVAIAHLVERDCRRIVHFDVTPERSLAYRTALKLARIPFHKELLLKPTTPHSFDLHEGRRIFREFLEKQIAFDAVHAPSDAHSIIVIEELLRRGIRVPQQVKVIGVDNSPLNASVIVPTSTLAYRMFERGQMAAKMIQRMVRGEKVQSIALEPTLTVRESTR